jgi:hypothetical protein
LSIDHFIGSVGPDGPVHDVKREVLGERIADLVALLVVVDELALVGWSNIELATLSANTALRVVFVVLNQITGMDLLEFNLHHSLSLLICGHKLQ